MKKKTNKKRHSISYLLVYLHSFIGVCICFAASTYGRSSDKNANRYLDYYSSCSA